MCYFFPHLSLGHVFFPLRFFFPIGVYAFPGDISGRDDEPDRLTRVLFDYYFGTYRALVISLCGHMVVQG